MCLSVLDPRYLPLIELYLPCSLNTILTLPSLFFFNVAARAGDAGDGRVIDGALPWHIQTHLQW